MDGLLVIDRLGRTNDPFIQAGGTVTTYQRRLGAADMDHHYYSALEVGYKMAVRMQQLWDPLLKARAHILERSPTSSTTASSRSSQTPSTVLRPADPRIVSTKSEGVSGEASPSASLE
ncbi:cilia- and flagella-associated protein 61-like [Thrips palmi]|uniref:Cilia- and flagella-associated protein 61-like n=1 Tax=Thrips palmi TaxID=161013 RepID=A0A6P8YMK2_THRPL|nr:cilia- and flagella-associated protein 61-like [Thrips palmi]